MKHYQNQSRFVGRGGRFKVGEFVAYNTTGTEFYRNFEFVKAKIFQIRDLGWSKTTFEYQLDMGGGLLLWTTEKKIKKIKKGDYCGDLNIGKFKTGDIVYSIYGNGFMSHEPLVIKRSNISMEDLNTIEYHVENMQGGRNVVRERYLKTTRKNVDDAKFKIGELLDFVDWRGTRTGRVSSVAEAFTYDDDTDVFYRLTGDIAGVTTDNNSFRRHKEPKIIFSEADPYGEEDWDEE